MKVDKQIESNKPYNFSYATQLDKPVDITLTVSLDWKTRIKALFTGKIFISYTHTQSLTPPPGNTFTTSKRSDRTRMPEATRGPRKKKR